MSKIKWSNSKELIEIIDYYLFHCPVKFPNKERVSCKGHTFDELNINLLKLLKKIEKTKVEIVVAKKLTETDKVLTDKNNVVKLLGSYRKIKKAKNGYKNSKLIVGNKLQMIFYIIRCALAHGNFELEKNRLKGINKYKNIVKGVFNLNYNILLEWIKIIKELSE